MSFTKTNFVLTNLGAIFLAHNTPLLSATCAVTGIAGGVLIHKAVEKIFQNLDPLHLKPAVIPKKQKYSHLIKNPFVQGLIAPVCEELFFREGLQNGLAKAFFSLGFSSPVSLTASLLGASTVFSWAHVSKLLHGEQPLQYRIVRAASTGFSGLLLGYAYLQGGLWASIGVHALVNSFLIIEDTAIQHFTEEATARRFRSI